MLSNLGLGLIIVNTMLGGGLFINLTNFNNSMGSWSPFLYLTAFLLYFPIYFSIGSLAQKQQVEGGLFILAERELGPYFGFLASWAYFVGRMVSVSVLLQAIAIGLQNSFPSLQAYGDLPIATALIFTMVLINVLGVSNSGKMQDAFILFKILPIFILIGLGALLFSPASYNFSSDLPLLKTNFFDNLPSAFYALQGFTIVIHMGHLIKKPNDVVKVLLISAAITATVCFLFQAVVFGSVGPSSESALPIFIKNLGIQRGPLNFFLNNMINISMLSASFMSITGNSWNLFAFAKNDFVPHKNLFLGQINNTPTASLVMHALGSLAFLFVTKNLSALQATSVLSVFFTYFLCSLAALMYFIKEKKHLIAIGALAIASTTYIILFSAQKVARTGLSQEFMICFLLGIFLALRKRFYLKKVSKTNEL